MELPWLIALAAADACHLEDRRRACCLSSMRLIKLWAFPPGGQPGLQDVGSFLWIAGLIELVTGALVLIGLFTRPAAFVAAGEMAVAYWMVHAKMGFYPAVNMGEAAILFCFVVSLPRRRRPRRVEHRRARG